MNRKEMYLSVFMAAAVAMCLVGTPVQASEADENIESAFKKTYVYTTYLKDDSIKANAKDGVVTLTGTVAGKFHKALAEDTAAGLAGVTRVDNQLTTESENADTWINRKLKFALLFHRNVNATATVVEVKDGIVTLKGEASSAAQKELTGEYAKDIEGVTEVKNQMTVAAAPEKVERTAGQKIDDASVTAQVKSALLTHRSTSSVSTKAETRNGEVTLTGIAKNEAEKALVTKLVNDINGVTSVKNQMTVDDIKTK